VYQDDLPSIDVATFFTHDCKAAMAQEEVIKL
jgi:hypothetical protein